MNTNKTVSAGRFAFLFLTSAAMVAALGSGSGMRTTLKASAPVVLTQSENLSQRLAEAENPSDRNASQSGTRYARAENPSQRLAEAENPSDRNASQSGTLYASAAENPSDVSARGVV